MRYSFIVELLFVNKQTYILLSHDAWFVKLCYCVTRVLYGCRMSDGLEDLLSGDRFGDNGSVVQQQ